MISDAMWAKYASIIDNFHDDANQQTVIWKRTISTRDRFGIKTTDEEIELKALIQYNFFRNWPINRITTSGEVDKESMLMYLNVEYLRENNYLTNENQFIFNQGYDRFIVEGIPYKPMGDSKAAQAKDKTLLVFIILQREEVSTTTDLK